jgi:hypothetical protein
VDDYQALINEARKAGATVRQSPRGHLKIILPNGNLVVASLSPSDRKAHHNLRAELRRQGLLPRNGFTLTEEEQAFLTELAGHESGMRSTELPPKRLLDKGLVRISKRSKGWMVWLTEKGKML